MEGEERTEERTLLSNEERKKNLEKKKKKTWKKKKKKRPKKKLELSSSEPQRTSVKLPSASKTSAMSFSALAATEKRPAST